MGNFKDSLVSDEERRRAEQEWDRYYKLEREGRLRTPLDYNIDSGVCAFLGHGPSHFYLRSGYRDWERNPHVVDPPRPADNDVTSDPTCGDTE